VSAEMARAAGACADRRYLVVTTGFSCNNRCTFCAQGELERKRSRAARCETTTERLRRLFDERGEKPDSAVAIVGGEPTIHDALPDLIAESRARGAATVHVQTNGRRLAYANYVRQLRDSGLNSLEISLAGPREDIHDYHTSVPGSFRQSIKGIRNAMLAGIDTALTVVITRSNCRHLLEAVEVATSLAVRALHFAFAQPQGRASANFPRVVPRIEACIPQLTRAGDVCGQLGLPLFVSGFPRCRLPSAGILPFDEAQPKPHGSSEYRPPCCDCGYRTTCPGISDVYRDRYSSAEIVAVRPGDCEQSHRCSYPLSKFTQPFVGIGRVADMESTCWIDS
jgi:organic radical activating enzyme